MNSARKQRWQQATALVSLSTAGAMTGIAFAHGTLADMTSPTSMPAHLMALKKAVRPTSTGDGALRSAIVSAASYYLRLAQGRTPAEMEALIWQNTSSDGADHGQSCAAFASLALEAGAQATGQQSWVTGGASYPWPLHDWADVRVDPNPQSPGIVSIMQDAQAHQRWHPIRDGYTPQAGDWVMFAGHVEVVTKYSGGVLYTIGGDSMPNLSVNAHLYSDPLDAQGVTGFVNNGELVSDQSPAPAAGAGQQSSPDEPAQEPAAKGQAVILGLAPPTGSVFAGQTGVGSPSEPQADGPALLGTADIPGIPASSGHGSAGSAPHRYSRSQVAPSGAPAPDTAAQRAFIEQVAPGALAAQRQHGIPAAVTIAQAIDESGWGQSQLATQDNNLFGIKGTGPAGSVTMPTQEYENGQYVTVNAPFRVYNNVTESIADHSLLLATGSSYKQAMADRQDPDAFARDLTGVYATDPSYGANLITIMRLYNLYRYSAGSQATPHGTASAGAAQGGAAAGTSGIGSGPGGLGAVGQAALGALGQAALGGAGQGALGAVGPAGPGAAGQASLGTVGPAVLGTPAVGEDPQTTAAVPASIPGVTDPGAPGHGAAAHRHHRAAPVREVSERQEAVASSSPRTREAGAARPGSRSAAQVASRDGSRSVAPAPRRAVATLAQAGRTDRGTSRLGRTGRPAPAASAPGYGMAAPAEGWLGGAGAGPADGGGLGLGAARIPGVGSGASGSSSQAGSDRPLRAGPRNARISTRRYQPQIPHVVTAAFVTSAKTPLLRAEPLYRDVAGETGLRWQLLAACDWMQCQARPRVSPVYGERLGTTNRDGTVYRTKSQALEQCAHDLITLAAEVYGIDLVERLYLSVCDLANVFAAFRWGGLLAAHHISAFEFPYSVEGLTAQHLRMRWPVIPEKPESDKPGTRFAMAFGAVPVVLQLGYRAVA